MGFEPIAIVGRGCILPDALDPDTFWANVLAGRVSLSTVPPDRWRLPRRWALGDAADHVDKTWSDVGGYVRGFENVFDPNGFAVDPGEIAGLDPLFLWVLHGARAALREAGQNGPLERGGLVIGNLRFPCASMARFAEQVLLDAQLPAVRGAFAAVARQGRPDGRNRFCSGLPAHFAAAALGLRQGGFALDAACASSLYAVKLACDRLHDRAADLMVAGAVTCSDDLFIHTGFCALSALSPSGRSRPFHNEADGLVPAEGAAFVALRRLPDAIASGAEIFGVIRGIGLSNDGCSGGLLAPAEEGQERAMRLAYQSAGFAPGTVSLVECHATGTQVGDAVEARSMNRVFAGPGDVPIGSVKSNVGHLITTAGAAGLLKVLGALRAGIRPPTVGAAEPISALAGTPLRLLHEAEEWPGPRRAAVSAFGFGGNNAHVVVDAWDGDHAARPPSAAFPMAPAVPVPQTPAGEELDVSEVAVVAMAVRAGGGNTGDFCGAVLEGTALRAACGHVDVALTGLRFPPRDLEVALGQQVLALDAAREAVDGLALPRERTAVLIGMGCDPEVARYGARWRVASWLEEADPVPDPDQVRRFRDCIHGPLTAAGVIGAMPNIVANRINAQLDLAGPSFVVCAEEASGIVALEIGARALRAGETDAAVVGAVDLSHEPVHLAAQRELGVDRAPGDAAVVLVLKRLTDARRDGDQVLAVLDRRGDKAPELAVGDGLPGFDPCELFGHPHAASGLLSVAAGVTALCHRAVPAVGAAAAPALGDGTADIVVKVLGAPDAHVRLRRGDTTAWLPDPPVRPYVYSGTDRDDVIAALGADQRADHGPARLVIMAADGTQLAERREAARSWLDGAATRPDGVAYRDAPIGGEIGFVYTNGSASYPGMGRDLMLAFPSIMADLEERCGPLHQVAGWAYGPEPASSPHVLDQIWGASLLSQLHTEITRGVLGIEPRAVLGYSSGESTALVAMRAWRDIQGLVADARAAELFTRSLVGPIDAVRRVWHRDGVPGERWASYMVGAPLDAVRRALDNEPAVHLMAVNAPGLSVIGGEANACRQVLHRLQSADAIPIEYDIAVHAPEVAEVREEWWNLHHRPTQDVPGVRFYSCASGDWYPAQARAAADAITAQAMGTIDFPRMISRAWAQGVRVFIEHGPRGLCTGWIKRILGERDHLAVALDSFNGSGKQQLARAIGELIAAGVGVNAEALSAHLVAPPRAGRSGPVVTLPAHPAPVELPQPEGPTEVMAPAPGLAPVAELSPAAELAPPAALPPAAEPMPAAELPPAAAAVPVSATARGTAHAARARAGAAPHEGGQAAAGLAHYQDVARVHREFLAGQADLHGRFMRLRGEVEAVLARRPGGDVDRHAALLAAGPATSLSPATGVPPAGGAKPGPAFGRDDLERLADGRVSEVFGAQFAVQDGYRQQTLLPQPPLLLADRVTGIDAVARSMGTGTIWTETDVRTDSWYLDPCGRMPAGVMVEAGQADMLLISWLGVDQLHRGERVYRLLGCELTFHGPSPVPGDTLAYEIAIDGHGENAGQRLFFFHSDCRVGGELRLSVRNGQAGYFTEAELAGTQGVIWDPADELPPDHVTADPPEMAAARIFGPGQLRAFADGRPADCFGADWERTRAHVRSPSIGEGRMQMLHEVTEFDPAGGPWRRGYLRAQTPISADDWFFDGHFKDDPCMPGTLMFEGCLQALSFYLAATGFTIERDGWRFEPVPDEPFSLRCRGQVTPASRSISYEVFVAGLSADPLPTLRADVLCTVDGVRAFHARHLALRLVPDWPLTHWREIGPRAEQRTAEPVPARVLGGLRGHRETKAVARAGEFSFGIDSLMACAWGRPTEAFGPSYEAFDGTRRVARLPGPPYHFMSRVVDVAGPMGEMQTGNRCVVEYDVPDEVWYFDQHGQPTMPFGVLMEVALQPCGWLASYAGCALTSQADLLFRNLDGTGTVLGEIRPGTRVLRTSAELTQISSGADVIIVAFTVECRADDAPVFRLTTSFGYFPAEAFTDQVGLPPTAAERARLDEPGGAPIDLGAHSSRAGSPGLPGPMLRMIDRVTGYWPQAGAAGLGRLRAEKDVDPAEWFFRAHFFQDPVQPGSLGVEAMLQLLKFYLIKRDAGAGLRRPRFESVMRDHQVTWKYRGQVTPANRRITIEMEIADYGEDARGRYAVAEAWLWVDGKRIYHATGLGVRVVAEQAPSPADSAETELIIDPAVDQWLLDHRPTWTAPALPMMSMADLLARGATGHVGGTITGLRDVRVHRWVAAAGPVRLRTAVTGDGDDLDVTLLAWREAATAALSRFEPVASATVRAGAPPATRPDPLAPLKAAVPAADPYGSGALFHGPSCQYLTSLRLGDAGASAVLDVGRGSIPRGLLHQGLLDAATHAIPHDELWRWSPDIGRDVVAYPHRIVSLDLYEPLPDAGEVRVEARFAGFDGTERQRPMFDLQLLAQDRVVAALQLVEVLLPKGALGSAPPGARRAFMRDRRYADGLGLSTTSDRVTRLSVEEVERCDWFPGTVASVYNLPAGARGRDHLATIAIRDHLARQRRIHPSAVDANASTPAPRLQVQQTADTVTVSDS
jgi:acyl transferase domain-containing protein/3-hydroxymyristoyl/3-hydroxydecanoyl-(acyl carrier protein) dehydratase